MAVAIETAEKIARHPPLAVRIEMETGSGSSERCPLNHWRA